MTQYWDLIVLLVHVAIVIGFSIRIIMRRLSAGAALAWIILIYIVPFLGAVLYLIFGEMNLGRRRARRAASFVQNYANWFKTLPAESLVHWRELRHSAVPLNRLAETTIGMPAMGGNSLQLFDSADEIMQAIIADIDAAATTCHMEFYIWGEGGLADEVMVALKRAVRRDVCCRLLLDGVGSKDFLRSGAVRELRRAGIDVVEALPVNPLRSLFVRFDLRLHRKLVVIDGEIAYTGSFNMVDPRYFKESAGVGQWVDAMARIEGPAVQILGTIFMADWEIETDRSVQEHDLKRLSPVGQANVQVIPSGPGYGVIHQLLLTAIYAAREELVMTTPYFVPDEAMFSALVSAAKRGVRVTIIVPERVDSRMARYASRAFFGDLLAAGVEILQFSDGLLHTKSIVMDGEVALFGTVNLDMRSFWLNFEVTLFVYDEAFGARLRTLQAEYIKRSQPVDAERWSERSFWRRLIDNTAQLFAPLI